MGKAMPLATFSEGRLMTPDELREVDIFADVDEKALLKYPGTVRRRLFQAGDVICREGEGGTTAFYIVEGSAQVFISRRRAGLGQRPGGLRAMLGRFFGQKTVSQPTHRANKLVPIDATVDLLYGDLAATLKAGDVFGEMSCLNLAPRSATVVAQTDCEMIEVLRNVYEVLQRSKTFKERMDEQYRLRALDNHLRNVPIFEALSPESIDELRRTATLLSVEAGTVIFREGDAPDGMYIVRIGQVCVSKRFPGGERRLAYLTRGDFFGETGLLRGLPRNATCTAVDHPVVEASSGRKRRPARVELVKIASDDFERVIRRHPEVVRRLEEAAEQRVKAQAKASLTILPSVASKEVEDLGLLQGQNLMLIDLEKCTRCDQCAQACSSAHDDGISRLIREGPRYDRYLVPASCRMCMDPVCMIGCPVGSIRRMEDLNIFIEDWCVGCGVCAKQCPYNSIQLHPLERFGEKEHERAKRVAETGEVVEVTERAVVCDQCSALPTGPACVYACPHDAAARVNARQFLHSSGLAASEESGL